MTITVMAAVVSAALSLYNSVLVFVFFRQMDRWVTAMEKRLTFLERLEMAPRNPTP